MNPISSLHAQAGQWRSLVEPAIRQLEEIRVARTHITGLADSFVAWESSATKLARRFSDVGLIIQKVQLAERLFAPNQVFADFAKGTVARIEQAADVRKGWALETSLHLAEEQLIAATDSLGGLVVTPDDQESVSSPLELRSPYVQQEELLAAVEKVDDDDEAGLIRRSPAVNAADLSRRVLVAITTSNEARKVAGSEEIFKPTTRLLEVYADMPWFLPSDKTTFAAFVDCLYVLFYEAAGKDNLRFLKANGGPIDDSDFDFILCIKHLRNKWTRHDADHGKDASIRKSWEELSVKFRWLGLNHLPCTADDFRLLHFSLLLKALGFANRIVQGIAGE